MPDIRLPNGKLIKGVPDGTSKEDIMKKAISSGLATEADFGIIKPAQPEVKPIEGSAIKDTAQTAATMITGALAEPVAGIAGALQAINPFSDEGSGAKTVKNVRESLTYQGGEGSQQQMANIAEVVAPAAEVLSDTERFLGKNVLELTGSPSLAAVAHSLPTAALEIIGFKGSRAARMPKTSISKKSVTKAMIESAPETEQIKSAATRVYNDIDKAGARIKKESLRSLAAKIEKDARAQGMDPRTTKISQGVVDAIKDSANSNQKLTELDTLRKISNAAAKSTDPTEKMLGTMIKGRVEDFMDNIKSTDMVKGSESLADTAKKYRTARNLYGRAKRSELINDAILEGQNARSGVENGIRNEINKITRSKKLKKFFPKNELDAMSQVVQGDFKTNFAKMLGRMGFMEGSSTSVLGSLGGVYAGSSLFGPVGAIATPAIGMTARQIAKKLTTGKARFVDTIVKSGKDGRRITEAYLKAVPKAKRSASDLSELLLDPEINISDLESLSNNMVKDALEIAKGRRAIDLASAAAVGASLPREEDSNGN